MGLAIQIVPQQSTPPPVRMRLSGGLQLGPLRSRRTGNPVLRLGATPVTPTMPPDSTFVAAVSPALETTGKFAARDSQMIAAGLQSLQLPFELSAYPDCNGMTQGAGTAAVLQIGGQTALKVAASTGPAAPFVAAAGGVLELVSAIFAGHAKAVKNEQQNSCVAIPAANESLQAIQQAFSAGQISAAQASQALDQVEASFMAQVQTSYQVGPPCNWDCQMNRVLQAIIAKLKALFAYQEAMGQGGAGLTATAAVSNAATSLGVPSWVLYAAAGLALFMFVGK